MKIDQEALAMFRNPTKAILSDFGHAVGGTQENQYAVEVFVAVALAEDRDSFIGNYDKLLDFMNTNKELIYEIITDLLSKLFQPPIDNKQ